MGCHAGKQHPRHKLVFDYASLFRKKSCFYFVQSAIWIMAKTCRYTANHVTASKQGS